MRELTSTFLPRTVPSTRRHGDWPLVGFAMLARACGTLESVAALAPSRRAVDAGALSRVLFEETVTFAWIAIDPSVNLDAWVRWDRRQRLNADNDLAQRGGAPLLSDHVRADYKRFIDNGPMMPENLTERAEQVDVHWSARVAAIEADPLSPTSFRGMYRYLYRTDSQ